MQALLYLKLVSNLPPNTRCGNLPNSRYSLIRYGGCLFYVNPVDFICTLYKQTIIINTCHVDLWNSKKRDTRNSLSASFFLYCNSIMRKFLTVLTCLSSRISTFTEKWRTWGSSEYLQQGKTGRSLDTLSFSFLQAFTINQNCKPRKTCYFCDQIIDGDSQLTDSLNGVTTSCGQMESNQFSNMSMSSQTLGVYWNAWATTSLKHYT